MFDRADMVFVTVGDDQADQIFLTIGDKGNVGHDDIDARRGVIAERHAAIHHQPFACRPVKAEIHPDLARAAQR